MKKLSDRRLRRLYALIHNPTQEKHEQNPGKLHLTFTTLSGKEQLFDFVGDPDAEGSPTARGPMSVTAEDTSGTHRFVPLMILIIATQKAVLDEGSHHLAMWTGSGFEFRQ